MEKNPLVASGEYERVFVCELGPGDVTSFDEVIEKVERVTDTRTIITLVSGSSWAFGHAGSTLLVKCK